MRKKEAGLPRKILAHSAWFSAIVCALSLVFSAYAYTSPTIKISLKERVNFIRATISPQAFILANFPKESVVVQSLNKPLQDSEYRFTTPRVEDLHGSINKFVSQIYGRTYEKETFDKWINAEGVLGVKWSPLIDDTKAKNDDNLNLLVRSLLFDYLQRLAQFVPTLQSVRNDPRYNSSFDSMIASSEYKEMPSFLAWFSTSMNKTFATISLEAQQNEKREVSLSKLLRLSLWVGAITLVYTIVATAFLNLPWPVFLISCFFLTTTVSSLGAAWAIKKSAIGIGELVLVFMILVFVTNIGLFSASVSQKKAVLLKKKVIFDAFVPLLLIIFMLSFINANVSTYLFFATMALYVIVVGYLLFIVKSAETKGASRRDERLRAEWKEKLRLISKELPLNDSHDLAVSLIDYVDSSATDFIRSSSNQDISSRLDELIGILSQPHHNPFIVRSRLLSIREILVETMN